MRVAVLAALCAALAYGQSATQVFSLSRSYMAQQVQEIANAIRVITVVPTNQAQLQLRIDSQAKTLTATGTADQLALAAWMLDALQSATGSELSHQYPDRTRIGGEVRVVHLRQFQTPQEIQEMVNTLRTIIDMAL
jgi:hypothetical protein